MAEDHDKLVAAAERLGYAMGDADSEYRALVLELFLLALEPLRQDVDYDFARSDMARECPSWRRTSPTTGLLAGAAHRCGLFSPQAGWHVHAGQPAQSPGQRAPADQRWL